MGDIPQRSIDELYARYDLEPELQDVYVEGLFDKEVLERCFQKNSERDRVVYEIGSVRIPFETLYKHGLTEGNKQRVIALAKELSGLPGDQKYRCIVDRDLDHWISSLETVPRLAWTEHVSLELYFFTEETLNDILIVTAKTKISSIRNYTNSLAEVLRFLYALRLASHTLSLNLTWIDTNKSISIDNGKILINQKDYITKLLNSNAKMAQREDFEANTNYWLDTLQGDHRNFIRGHDFVDLLAWTIKEFKGLKYLASSECIERLFILIADKTTELLKLVR